MEEETVLQNETANKNDEAMSLEDLNIKGDVIGDTAYSQRFVLNTLIQLSKIEDVESSNEFIEKDLCTVWDMTTEEDVSMFLLEHETIDIFHTILKNSEDSRLLEVVLGMIANMSCFKNVILRIKQKRDFILDVLTHTKSADPLVLVQVLRFAFTCVYNDASNSKFWLECCADTEFQQSLQFIMENSINENVLIHSLEMLNCVFSLCVNSDKKLFIELFVNEQYVKSLITAFQELLNCLNSLEGSIEETIDRAYAVYLTTMWGFSNFDDYPSMVNDDDKEKLVQQLRLILEDSWKRKNGLIIDSAEYITGILSALTFPRTDDAMEITKIFISIWKSVVKSDEDDKNDFEEPEDEDLKIEFVPIGTNYFARIIKIWPREEIKALFGDFDKIHITALYHKIREGIENEQVDTYYGDVCGIINKLFCVEENDADDK